MKKRLLSALLMLAMLLTMLPVTAGAAGTISSLSYTFRLYEYNPLLEENVRVPDSEERDALKEAIREYAPHPYATISDAEIPTSIQTPSGTSVTTDMETGLPEMSYTTDEGVAYTWLCTGYEVDNQIHEWTPEELEQGYASIDLAEYEGERAYVYYCWTREGRMEEDASEDYETVTLTFDFWTIIKNTNGAEGAPALNLPDGCDLTTAEYQLYGSNTVDKGMPSDIAAAIKAETIVPIETGDDFVDGSLQVEWPKGYFVTFEDVLKRQYGYDYYYIVITDTPYVWYGNAGSWNTESGTTFNPLQTIVPEDNTTLYAVYHSRYMPIYLPVEGYTLVYAENANILVEDSAWSKQDFNKIQRTEITFPDFTWSGYMAVPDEWTFTAAVPVASYNNEDGNVFLTDGTFTWQCVGVQYSLVWGEEATTIEHKDWNKPLKITIEDTSVLDPSGTNNGLFFLEYRWKEVTFGTPPRTYNVKYDFQLPNELSEVSGRRVFPVKHHDDNWGSYDAWDMFSGDGEFDENSLTKLQNEIKASDTTVREGTDLIILADAPDNLSSYLDFRDFLAFNDKKDIYYEFGGWMDETGKVRQIGETVSVDELTADEDDTITLKATWEPITGLSDELYQKAADTLQLQVLGQDKDFAVPVLLTQWTDTDSNVGANNKLTGNPVILGTGNTLYYTVSATLNSGLFGSSDPNAITMGDCVALTFTLDIDPKLEFASEESTTITYNNPNLELVRTNFGEVTGPDEDGNYTVTFDPSGELPRNDNGGLHLEFGVEIINQREPVFHQNASVPMKFTGFAFQLKDRVETDGLVIESKGNVTGQMDLDKISNAGYHHRFRYYQVRSHLQSRDEWQALFGGATEPTAYVHAMQFIDKKLADYDLSKDKMSPVEANTVVAYSSAITVKPANMTIYEGGDGGYDAVVGDNGEIVEGTNSLPHPLFEITAPNGVDLAGMTFTNADSGNTWTLTQLNGTDYYRFAPMTTGGTEVRVQYSDGETVVTEDEFTPETDVFKQYTISIYDGGTSGEVIAKAADGKNYLVETDTGTLTVRAVADKTDPTSDVEDAAPATKVGAGKATAVAPAGTTYTLNDTEVALPTDGTAKPSLLFDDIIDADVDRTGELKKKVDTYLGGADADREYQIKYLDLVDANNGNAWITSSKGTDIYWGYPEGTDSSTSFKLLHFVGLHRDDSNNGNSGFDVNDISSATVETVEKVENTPNGIKFHVGKAGFSPFALVWTESTGGGGGGTTYYTITATADDGGSIDPSGSVRVASGRDKTFTITADEGYEIADVLVDGESVGAVSEYTFENVRKKHTIEARFEATGEIPVKDPDETGVSDWLNTDDHIAYMSGYPEGDFRPDVDMTRAEAAQMFYNLLLDKDTAAEASFSDVPANAWYAEAVNALASIGVIEGIGDNQYAPDRAITRAEFTAIAMRFADLETGGENIFSDVAENAWYYDYVVGSIQYGWINGYPDGTFRPENTISRVEVTTIVNRMLGRSADENFVDSHADELRQFTDVNDSHWGYYNIMEAANAHDFTMENNTENWTALR